MGLTIQLSDHQARALEARAAAEGLSLEAWLEKLAQEQPPAQPVSESIAGQFQREHGIWVYRTGDPMPLSLVDDTLALIRRERESDFLRSDS